KFIHFLTYNNTVPIVLGVLFLGAGTTLAASPQVREAILDSYEEVQSVDNTYIGSANLETRDFGLRVTSITEDAERYYVSYTYRTISVIDYVWRETNVSKIMEVTKKEVEGKDLGLFVAKQLGEEIRAQAAYLAEVQESERKKGAS